MKKAISLLLLCSLVFIGLTGCAGNENRPVELQSQDPLVGALVDYLHDFLVFHDMPDNSVAIRIDKIKNGSQPLHIRFEPAASYFVGAYYDAPHDETGDHCCVDKYTWVKFENAHDISETYKDKEFIVAFQMNKSSFVTNLLNKEAAVPKVEHFRRFTPDFQEGFNIADPLPFDETFILLNGSNYLNGSTSDETIYYSMDLYYHILVTFPCTTVNNRYYIVAYLYSLYPDGSDLDRDFGAYRDILTSHMRKCSITSLVNEQERTYFYGLIPIEDLADCIKD